MSFADELKALALTAPKERDTEDVFNEDSAAKVTHSSTDYESLPSRARATLLNEPKYEGRTISRKDIMLEDEQFPDEHFELDPDLYDIHGADDESDTDHDDGVEEGDSDPDEADEEAQQSIDEEETDSDSVDENLDVSESLEGHSQRVVEDQDSEHSDSESVEDDSNDEEDDDADGGPDYDISQFMDQAKMNSRRSNLNGSNDKFNHLEDLVLKKISTSNDVSEDVRKGRCIGHQLNIWDKLLEYRIQFQRVLALSNQLPPFEIFGSVMKEFLAESDNNRLYRQSVKNIEKAFGQLIAIREQLVEMYPEVRKSLENRKSTNSGANDNDEEIASDDEEIPSDIASGYSESDGEQATQVHKSLTSKRLREEEDEDSGCGRQVEDSEVGPNKKMRIDSATSSLTTEQFHQKLLNFRNATIEKWYQRTKLGAGPKGSKAGYTALEQPPLKQIEHIMADQERLLQRTRMKRSQYNIVGLKDLNQHASGDGGEDSVKETLTEIFDDDDFYHHLLREVIERKTQDVSDPFEISRHWIEIQKLRSKIKRRVDTKASKGRRIRYDVMPKLVSFMTPHDAATFSEQARNDLFSSIFGKRSVTSKTETRTNVPKKDIAGFKLFS